MCGGWRVDLVYWESLRWFRRREEEGMRQGHSTGRRGEGQGEGPGTTLSSSEVWEDSLRDGPRRGTHEVRGVLGRGSRLFHDR